MCGHSRKVIVAVRCNSIEALLALIVSMLVRVNPYFIHIIVSLIPRTGVVTEHMSHDLIDRACPAKQGWESDRSCHGAVIGHQFADPYRGML